MKQKKLIRERMLKTGEGWQAAQRHVLAQEPTAKVPAPEATLPTQQESLKARNLEADPTSRPESPLEELELEHGPEEAALAAMRAGFAPATLKYLHELGALKRTLNPPWLKALKEATAPFAEARRVADLFKRPALLLEAERMARLAAPRDPLAKAFDAFAPKAFDAFAPKAFDALKPPRNIALETLQRAVVPRLAALEAVEALTRALQLPNLDAVRAMKARTKTTRRARKRRK